MLWTNNPTKVVVNPSIDLQSVDNLPTNLPQLLLGLSNH